MTDLKKYEVRLNVMIGRDTYAKDENDAIDIVEHLLNGLLDGWGASLVTERTAKILEDADVA